MPRFFKNSAIKSALIIAAIYAIIGVLWIRFSDKELLELFPKDSALLSQFQTYKGWFYVLVTAVLVFLLVYRQIRQLTKLADNLKNRSTELELVNENLLVQMSQRKQTELALRESEQKVRSFSNASFEGIIVTENGQFVDANNTFYQLMGYTPKEMEGKRVEQIVAPYDRKRVLQHIKERYSKPYQHDILHKDGSIINVEICGADATYQGRQCRITAMHDITAHKQVHAALKQERDFSQAVLSTIEALVVVLDTQGRIIAFNRACETCTGFTIDDVIGKHFWDPTLIPGNTDRAKQAFTQQNNNDFSSRFECYWLTATGDNRRIEWTTTSIKNADGNIEYLIGTGNDITERRALESRLQQAQKLEAIGQLAAGVAHDFNNLLMPILHFTSYGSKQLGNDTPLGKRLNIANQAAAQAKKLTSHLLTLGQKQMTETQTLDLNYLINESQPILRRMVKDNIDVTFNLTDKIALIEADQTQMQQILLNLIVNASDAITDKGQISISTENLDLLTAEPLDNIELEPGKYVLLKVKDNGCGMDDATQLHIFEPFFTTKDRGSGTGLGLSTVFAIVKQHHGHVICHSKQNQGTTFEIYLRQATHIDDSQTL